MDQWNQLACVYEVLIANQSAIEMNKSSVYAWIRLGNLFQKQGRFLEAIEAYKRVVEIKPNNAHFWNEFGNLYYNAGLYDEAVQAYFRAIQLDAWLGWAYCNLGLTFTAKGNYREAEMLFQKGIDLLGQNSEKALAWNRLGNLFRELAKYEKAFEAYRIADRHYPEVAKTTSERHLLSNDFGLIEGAIAISDSDHWPGIEQKTFCSDGYSARMGTDPKTAQLWNELGNIYFYKRAYDDALTAYLEAIKLDSRFGWPYSNMALVLSQKGDYDKALSLYQKSLTLIKDSPLKAISWNGLGNLYRVIGDYRNAALAYRAADVCKSIENDA